MRRRSSRSSSGIEGGAGRVMCVYTLAKHFLSLSLYLYNLYV